MLPNVDVIVVNGYTNSLCLSRIRDDDIPQSDVSIVIGVMRNATCNTHEKNVVDLLEGAQQSRCGVSGSCHGFSGVAD